MSIENNFKGFSIFDSRERMVFDLNAHTKKYVFYNQTLELEIQSGIPIPPIARSQFEGKPLVKPPNGESPVSFDLFMKAVLSHFDSCLKRDGFKLIEKA